MVFRNNTSLDNAGKIFRQRMQDRQKRVGGVAGGEKTSIANIGIYSNIPLAQVLPIIKRIVDAEMRSKIEINSYADLIKACNILGNSDKFEDVTEAIFIELSANNKVFTQFKSRIRKSLES